MVHFRALPRVVAVAAAGASALAGLAVTSVVTSGPAAATETSIVASYNCAFTISLLGIPVSATLPVPVTVTVADVPMWDGTPVASGSVPLEVELDLDSLTDIEGLPISNAIIQLIGLDGALGGTLGLDASHPATVGSVPVTSALSAAPVLLDDLFSDGVMDTEGALGAFTPQGSGLESVTLPSTFSLVPSGTSGPSIGALLPVSFAPVSCTSETGAPSVVARVRIGTAKPGSSRRLSVVGPKRARHGTSVAFRVSLPGGVGRVVAKVGRRMVGQSFLADGTAKVKVRGLHTGANRIVFSTGSAKAGVTVRVR